MVFLFWWGGGGVWGTAVDSSGLGLENPVKMVQEERAIGWVRKMSNAFS